MHEQLCIFDMLSGGVFMIALLSQHKYWSRLSRA